MRKFFAQSCGTTMDKPLDPVVTIWCRGPGIPDKELTGIERMSLVFRKSAESPHAGLLESVAEKFGECGPQRVKLDTSNLQDVWPDLCPVCGNDTYWDLKGFVKNYPQWYPFFAEAFEGSKD